MKKDKANRNGHFPVALNQDEELSLRKLREAVLECTMLAERNNNMAKEKTIEAGVLLKRFAEKHGMVIPPDRNATANFDWSTYKFIALNPVTPPSVETTETK